MSRWWDRYPERLKRELRELEEAGIPYTPVAEDLARGVYSLRLTVTVDDAAHEVVATFPDLYPFFRFEVRAPTLELEHHQHPFGKNLCLVGRSTANWLPGDTLASFIQKQLPRVVEAGTVDEQTAATIEQHQAEPFSSYFPYVPAMCLVDSTWAIPEEIRSGDLLLGVIDLTRPDNRLPPMLTAAVLEVRDARGRTLAQAEPAIRGTFGGRTFVGRWCRLDDRTAGAAEDSETHAQALWRIAQKLDPLHTNQRPYAHEGKIDFAVRGLLIREEVRYRTEGNGWVFVVQVRHLAPKSLGGKKPPPKIPAAYYFARGGRAGREDLGARSVELAPVADRRIAQVGLGCLGAISAWEFARAGVGRIRALDDDVVDPATTRRWPLGLGVAGQWKGYAVATNLKRHYPLMEFEARIRRLGAPRQHHDDAEPDELVLDWLLQDASLVYDASAEVGVQRVLAAYAATRQLPYIRVAASPGAWGGYVLRIRPDQTAGCAWCFETYREEGFANPPEDPRGLFQPLGCASPTYVGPGFELAQIALHGVRLAVSTLCEGTGGFPAVRWDVAVIRLRNADGELLAPEVTTYPLDRHPECPACGASAA